MNTFVDALQRPVWLQQSPQKNSNNCNNNNTKHIKITISQKQKQHECVCSNPADVACAIPPFPLPPRQCSFYNCAFIGN